MCVCGTDTSKRPAPFDLRAFATDRQMNQGSDHSLRLLALRECQPPRAGEWFWGWPNLSTDIHHIFESIYNAELPNRLKKSYRDRRQHCHQDGPIQHGVSPDVPGSSPVPYSFKRVSGEVRGLFLMGQDWTPTRSAHVCQRSMSCCFLFGFCAERSFSSVRSASMSNNCH